jgi:hypothetical protein
MESTREITEEITCEKCGETREIISLGMCENCLDIHDRHMQDREDYWREEAE